MNLVSLADCPPKSADLIAFEKTLQPKPAVQPKPADPTPKTTTTTQAEGTAPGATGASVGVARAIPLPKLPTALAGFGTGLL